MGELGQLAVYLPHIKNVRIVCVGDLMLDRYIYGEVERISPEAPIPVIRWGGREMWFEMLRRWARRSL